MAAAAIVAGTTQPVFADVPLPIIDIIPQQYFTVTGNSSPLQVKPTFPVIPYTGNAPLNNFVLGGTFTEPLFKGASISFDHIAGGGLDTALTAVGVGPGGSAPYVYPGPASDYIENYRLDYHIGPFNVEGGYGRRHRMCCAFGTGPEWHKGFVGISYATPHFDFLNHGFFVLDITGNASRFYHPDTADYLAAGYPPSVVIAQFPESAQALELQYGTGIPQNRIVYTTQQAITAIVPVDLKHGVRVAGTFLWGYLDYPMTAPFPDTYDVFVMSGTKQFNEYFGITANVTNVTQREQGNPFPAPGAIHTTALAIAADFHIDFHKLIGTTPRGGTGRSTQPGTPGGPGGPAPISPTQGGATSAPSPMPMMSPESTMPAPAPSPSP